MSRWTSYNRWNWAAFDDRDHLGDPSRPLRERVLADAGSAGVELQDGPIFLLTNLRYLGYAFNPVSFYYCCTHAGERAGGARRGQQHVWRLAQLLAGSGGQGASRTLRYAAPKVFHVSPFMPMAMDYEFAFTRPGDRLVAHMSTLQEGRKAFDATLSLERRPWTSREIRRILLRHPFMTGKVMAGIHYEALRLYWKRAPFYPSPHAAGPRAGRGADTSTT